MSTEEQRLVTTYLGPDLLERAQSWGFIFIALGAGVFLGCLGAWLFIKPSVKEVVRVEVPPAQVVKVEVPTPVVQPAPSPPPPIDMTQYVRKDEPTKTTNGEPIKREVTVFSSVAHTTGFVMSGWQFRDGAAGSPPFHQFCYYLFKNTTSGTDIKVDIANDAVATTTDHSLVPDYMNAVSKCQWYEGGSTKVTETEPPRVNRVTTGPVYADPPIMNGKDDISTTFIRRH